MCKQSLYPSSVLTGGRLPLAAEAPAPSPSGGSAGSAEDEERCFVRSSN